MGWKNFCHKTHIQMPVKGLPDDDEKLHSLVLPVEVPATGTSPHSKTYYYQFVEGNSQESQGFKFVFHTAAECKAFEGDRFIKPSSRPKAGPSVDRSLYAE